MISASDRSSSQPWQLRDRFMQLQSRWLTLIGEHWTDEHGQDLEYWRIEKADSVIVVPIQANHLLLPAPSYRPGVAELTWDFPGGRVGDGQSPTEAAIAVLQRELAIAPSQIRQLMSLNSVGWAVNSSFSNQRLYGVVAHLAAEVPIERAAMTIAVHRAAIAHLQNQLTCLQCRAVLWEWWMQMDL